MAANRVRAAQLLEGAGLAFGTFVFFTLMLVLIAIERNTRTLAAGPSAHRAGPSGLHSTEN